MLYEVFIQRLKRFFLSRFLTFLTFFYFNVNVLHLCLKPMNARQKVGLQ